MKCERIACDAPATRRVVTYWSGVDWPDEQRLCLQHATAEKDVLLQVNRVISCFSNPMKEAA